MAASSGDRQGGAAGSEPVAGKPAFELPLFLNPMVPETVRTIKAPSIISAAKCPITFTRFGARGITEVLLHERSNFRSHQVHRMGFPAAHNVRQRPLGLGLPRDVCAPRNGVLPYRSTRTSRTLGNQINIGPGISRIPARNH